MKAFFKMVFASTLGFFIAIFVIGFIFILSLVGIVASIGTHTQAYLPQKNTVLQIDLKGSMNDRIIHNPFASLWRNPDLEQLSMIDIVSAIKKAKENNDIKGIYLKAELLFAGISSVEAVRNALIDFKESGKFVIAYGGNYSQSAYYLSSVADMVILNPQGTVDLHGLATVPMFYTGLMEKLGIKMEVFKVGTFKSAVEPFMLDKMSDANREQVRSYIGSLWNNVSENIAISRELDRNDLNKWIDEGLFFKDPSVLVDAGIVDTLLYSTEADDYIKDYIGIDRREDLNITTVTNMKSIQTIEVKEANELAVLFAEGEITQAPSGTFNMESVISDKEYVKQLRKLRENDYVKAVVFRVNSPGGSAYMSDQIWKEVIELKKVKPVVVSMGDYAASGGYYISCGADWIIAEPTTITGSIGVFGIVPTFEGLMNKVSLTTDVEKTNKYADFGNLSRSLSIGEKNILQANTERWYDVFLTRCAEGRNKSKDEIDAIGQGRVWTGEQALKNGLVDELGGLNKAIEVAAQRAGIEKYSIKHYPEEKDFFTLLLEESMLNVKVNLLKNFFSETEYRHITLIKNVEKIDNIQARLPFDIEVK